MILDRVFRFYTKPKNENSKRFKKEMAAKLDRRAIKYCSERINSEETVLGRNGMINLRQGELILLSSDRVVFRCKIEELTASELMSLEGAILTGPDLEHDGLCRTVIAYYTDPYRTTSKI